MVNEDRMMFWNHSQRGEWRSGRFASSYGLNLAFGGYQKPLHCPVFLRSITYPHLVFPFQITTGEQSSPRKAPSPGSWVSPS